jgi:hypothetical protein
LAIGCTDVAHLQPGSNAARPLECEPRCVDVAIQHREAYTKSEVVLEGDGRTVKAE